MTNEEAKALIEKWMNIIAEEGLHFAEEYRQAFTVAIKALEQKNEDIAKAFQFGLAFGFGKKYDEMDRMIDEIKKVITPQPKTGHWIFDEILDKHYYCSECKSMGVDYWDYCPYCGAKMIASQGGEDKE